MPDGGNPAMVIKNNIIAVSGSGTEYHAGESHPVGTGVSYSLDNGYTWNYMSQSVDSLPNLWSCKQYEYGNIFLLMKVIANLIVIIVMVNRGSAVRYMIM